MIFFFLIVNFHHISFFLNKKINSAGSIMRVHHSHNGNLLDDGSAAVTHYEFDSGGCFSAFWHLGHGRCLHGLHEGIYPTICASVI